MASHGRVWGPPILPERAARALGPGQLSDLEEESPPRNGQLIKTIMTPFLMTVEALGLQFARLMSPVSQRPPLCLLLGAEVGWGQWDRM